MRWIPLVVVLFISTSAAARDLAVHPESVASYAVDETWMGGPRTIHGTNSGVTGTLAWNDSAGGLSFPATILVDAAGFKTDTKARDKKVANSLLDAAAHPKIIFTLTACDPPLAKVLPAKTTAKGTVEIRGKKKDLEMPVDITPSKDGKTLVVTGKAVEKFADFGIEVPVVPFIAKAHDSVTLEISLVIDAP